MLTFASHSTIWLPGFDADGVGRMVHANDVQLLLEALQLREDSFSAA